MKKSLVLCTGLCVVLAFTSCKSGESAYKKAYEKAKAQEAIQQEETPIVEETPVVTPIVQQPVTQTTVTNAADNVSVRQENVELVNGNGLKAYSVVVGSFSVLPNAEGLQKQLKAAGYDAQIVKNVDRNMYRVVASSFDQKVDAAQSRDQFRSKYPDAWLLYKK